MKLKQILRHVNRRKRQEGCILTIVAIIVAIISWTIVITHWSDFFPL